MSEIAFVGDIHDNEDFLDEIFETFDKNDVRDVVLLGDITTSSTLQRFDGYVTHIVFGNADMDNIRGLCKTANEIGAIVYGRGGRKTFGSKVFNFRHGVEPRELSYVMAAHNAHYVVHGHYHSIENTPCGSGRVLSPGAPGCLLYDVGTDEFEQVEYPEVDHE